METLFKKVVESNAPKVIAIAKNYVKHANIMGADVPKEPVIFTKPLSSITRNNAPIVIPAYMKEMHHEIELGFIVSKRAKNVAAKDALDYVGGYFLALDMTDREFQGHFKKQGFPWDLAKGFDGAMPVSAFVAKDKVRDPHQLELRLTINGKVIQNDSTSDMYYKIPHLIEYVSKFVTLNEGDLFITGTPGGIGPVWDQDKIEALLLQDGKELAAIRTLCVLERSKL